MPDVIVVGGGVIGCATARELAHRGATVTVVERGTPGRGATWAAAGMLSPLGPAGSFRDLARASFDRYPHFVEGLTAETGIDVDFATTGKLHLAFDAAEAAGLVSLAATSEPFGLRWLDETEALALEPCLNAAGTAFLLVAADYRVDNRRLGEATHAAAVAAGARFETGTVREILAEGRPGRARGVRLEDGSALAADAIVLAAGAWTGAIHGLPYPLPVRPVRGQMLALATTGPDSPRLDHTVETARCYLVPRTDGRILVGATVEEVGFTPGPTLAGITALAAAAVEAVPTLDAAPLVETWSGFRPGTPDGLPIIGEDPDLPGLFYATGHYRNGILLAPATAEAIADAINRAVPAIDTLAFGRERFLDRGRGSAGLGSGSLAAAGTPDVETAGGFPCDLCGAPMLEMHCRLRCPKCGYTRSCEDP